MAEEEVSVVAKLIDMVTSPVKIVVEAIEGLLGVSKKVEGEETLTPALTRWSQILNALVLIFPGLNPLLGGFIRTIGTVSTVVDTVKETTNKYKDAVETLGDVIPKTEKTMPPLEESLKKVGDEEDDTRTSASLLKSGLENLKSAAEETGGKINEIDLSEAKGEMSGMSKALGSVARQAMVTRIAVTALRAEIAALHSKTIVITTVRKTVYKTEGSSSGGSSSVSKGSNPFGADGGRPSMTAPEAKTFTEQITLPALKTLAREGKVEEIVR